MPSKTMVHFRGTYIGAQDYLKGKTALLAMEPFQPFVWVQFDDLRLPIGLTHGWTPMRPNDFIGEPYRPTMAELKDKIYRGTFTSEDQKLIDEMPNADPTFDRFPGPPRDNY
jgi:hypothetical protein